MTLNNHIDNNHRDFRVNEDISIEENITIQSHEERFQCNECYSYLAYPYTLQLHIKNNHIGDKFCCQCNFQTTSDEKLEEHINLLNNPMIYSGDLNTSIIPQKRPIIHDSSTETSISREDNELSLNMKTKYDNASK